jgi:uroporphyrinogen-III synthase
MRAKLSTPKKRATAVRPPEEPDNKLWRGAASRLGCVRLSTSNQPLSNRRIVVTRAREQASELASKLTQLGAEVIELPLIRVTKHIEKDTLSDVMAELGTYDWIVFTSANGVRFFFEEFFRLFDEIRSLGLLRFACIGDATAKAIRDLHLRIECQPDVATAEALADALIATGSIDSTKILIITGNLNREVLVQKLEEARGIVDQLQVYKTEKTNLEHDPAASDFRRRGGDAILFASSSAVQSFVDQAASLKLLKEAKRPLAGSIGPQTSETMKKLGMPVDFEAKTPSLDAFAEAVVKKLGS